MDWVAVSAIVISVLTFVHGIMADRRNAKTDRLETIEAKIERLEEEVAECEKDRKEWTTERVTLMEEIIRLRRKTDRDTSSTSIKNKE